MGRNTDNQPLPKMPYGIHDLGVADGDSDGKGFYVQSQAFRNDAIRDRVGVVGDDHVVDPDAYGETEDGWMPQDRYTGRGDSGTSSY